MACECGNFLRFTALRGKCYEDCLLHPSNRQHPELTVHATYSPSGLIEGLEDKKRRAENISYEETLGYKHNLACPKCKGPVRVSFETNGMYLYVCSECHTLVEKPVEVSSSSTDKKK